jgi:hypothetical protein
MMQDPPWGGPERYYSQEGPNVDHAPFAVDQVRALTKQLGQLFPNLRDRVERAFKESNVLIREQLRIETGLRLSNEDVRQSIPVRVVDGFSWPLRTTIIDNPTLISLYLDLKLFKSSTHGLSKLKSHYAFLQSWPPVSGKLAYIEALNQSQDTMNSLISALERLKPFESIYQIEEDFLGAYFFWKPCIELYWMPIGIVAAGLEISPEALTKVVAIHELAHAYTHLGFDTDGHNWNTDAFSFTTTYVIEGLAQFYTEAVCRRLESRHPEILEAFEKFLNKQSGPYRAHLDWAKDVETRNEIIRNSMIQCRSVIGTTQYEAFLLMMDHHTELIGKRRKPTKWQAFP